MQEYLFVTDSTNQLHCYFKNVTKGHHFTFALTTRRPFGISTYAANNQNYDSCKMIFTFKPYPLHAHNCTQSYTLASSLYHFAVLSYGPYTNVCRDIAVMSLDLFNKVTLLTNWKYILPPSKYRILFQHLAGLITEFVVVFELKNRFYSIICFQNFSVVTAKQLNVNGSNGACTMTAASYANSALLRAYLEPKDKFNTMNNYRN